MRPELEVWADGHAEPDAVAAYLKDANAFFKLATENVEAMSDSLDRRYRVMNGDPTKAASRAQETKTKPEVDVMSDKLQQQRAGISVQYAECALQLRKLTERERELGNALMLINEQLMELEKEKAAAPPPTSDKSE